MKIGMNFKFRRLLYGSESMTMKLFLAEMTVAMAFARSCVCVPERLELEGIEIVDKF